MREIVLRSLAAAAPLTVFVRLASSPKGLSETEAADRLTTAGENRVEPTPTPGRTARLRSALGSPFVALLAGLGLVFAVVGDARGAITVFVMVVLGVALRWWQQVRSDQALRALRGLVTTTATVRRRAETGCLPVDREVPVEDVVPGDLVVLAPGDLVPADVRLLTSRDLLVDQSALSGETLPVRKQAHSGPDRRAAEVVDLGSLCFAGTSVVGGTATAVVIATGASTYFGSVAREARARRPASSVDSGVSAVGWALIRFMLVMVPIVVVVNGSVTGDWAQAALFAVSVAVGLTPEMLPVIVTTTLARGAANLARHKVIVKRLDAIGDLGAMDVLCVDKTGTLTEDRVVFAHGVDVTGRRDDDVAAHAFLAGHFQSVSHNRLDEAVADYVMDGRPLVAEATFTKVDEVPFDHERRSSAVVLQRHVGEHLLITKGDPDEILGRCAQARHTGDIVTLTPELRRQAEDLVARAHASGMRMLAVAARHTPSRLGSYGAADETELTLVGFVGFVDPVRATAVAAVARLGAHGVAVKVLTGDSPLIARRVCEQAGIATGEIVVGHDVEVATDAELRAMVEHTTVFAKINPRHKARVVAALRTGGHCVGFVGDGVNDTPALRTADVGISVDTATDAAKDAADLVLLDKDLTVLARAVVDGRRTLGNTMKYVKITAASNVGNAVGVVVASAFLPFLPMLPMQLMAQNLLYDAAQLALPWDRVDTEYLRRPRRWDAGGLTGFVLVFGPLSSLFDVVTFATLWWVMGVDDPYQQALFQAGWFVEGLLSQVLVVLVLRGSRLSLPSWPVSAAAALAVSAGLLLAFTPLGTLLHMTPLPAAYVPWLLAILLAYLSAAQLTKTLYRRRTHLWL